jgi:hypothetical protein
VCFVQEASLRKAVDLPLEAGWALGGKTFVIRDHLLTGAAYVMARLYHIRVENISFKSLVSAIQ